MEGGIGSGSVTIVDRDMHRGHEKEGHEGIYASLLQKAIGDDKSDVIREIAQNARHDDDGKRDILGKILENKFETAKEDGENKLEALRHFSNLRHEFDEKMCRMEKDIREEAEKTREEFRRFRDEDKRDRLNKLEILDGVRSFVCGTGCSTSTSK